MIDPEVASRDFLFRVYESSKHGDDEHRRWLYDKLLGFQGELEELIIAARSEAIWISHGNKL